MTYRVIILISGNGSNLQAIINAIGNDLPAEIACVISDNTDAYGLTRAKQANIATHVLTKQQYPKREDYDRALDQIIQQYQPDLILLAGFMRILSPWFVQQHHGRLINIHPSLLPKYRGLMTHQRVLDAGDKQHGVSIHFVTEDLDGGPLITQATIPVANNETAESLETKIHAIEHIIYPEVLRWFAAGKLKLVDNIVYLNEKPVPKSGFPFPLSNDFCIIQD